MVRGYTLLEVLWALALFGLLTSAALDAMRTTPRVEQCGKLLRSALADAAQQALLSRSERHISFEKATGRVMMEPPPLLLTRMPKRCSLLASGFGAHGGKSEDAVLYGNGVTSPGSVLIGGKDGTCRVTQSLYGKHGIVCRSTLYDDSR